MVNKKIEKFKKFIVKFLRTDPIFGSIFIPSYSVIIFLTQYRVDFLGMEGKVTT